MYVCVCDVGIYIQYMCLGVYALFIYCVFYSV